MPNVAQGLALDVRFRLEELASNLGGGTYRQQLARADLYEWERTKYVNWYHEVAMPGKCHWKQGAQGAGKARFNMMLDELKGMHKFQRL